MLWIWEVRVFGICITSEGHPRISHNLWREREFFLYLLVLGEEEKGSTCAIV